MRRPRNRLRSRALVVLFGVPLVIDGHEVFARDDAVGPPSRVGVRQTAGERGALAGGGGFTSDFGVVRDHRGLRGNTPVYWSGVTTAG